MKIALICTEKLPVPPVSGGAIQMYIEGVLPHISSRHDITVYSIQNPGLADEEVRDNVRYIRVAGRTNTMYINSLRSAIAAHCGADGATPYELIHVFNRPKYLLALSQTFPRQKFSLSLHNEMLHNEKISDEAGLKCIERTEFINTVSKYIADTVVDRFPEAEGKMHVVYSGADHSKYIPAWTEAGAAKKHEMKQKFGLHSHRVILYVGRLSVKKGVHILIKAMEKVMSTHPDTALVIAGSKWYGNNNTDDYTDSLNTLIKKLPGPVILTGFIPPSEIPDYYSMGDVFVCASQWNEPLARVHYEAMAAGLPIITTNRGGNAEVVSTGTAVQGSTVSASSDSCGIVIDQYYDSDVMADNISFLLDHPELCLSMGKRGRQQAEAKFNWKRVADEIFELVELRSPDPSDTPDEDPPASMPNDNENNGNGVTNISIIGTGYVGLVTGVCLASMGRNVMCCDKDSSKIEMLNRGILPIFEPSLKNLADNCIRKQRLSFTTDISKAVGHSDIIFITVDTPTLADDTCDTGSVFEVARNIGVHMDRYKVIVNKSTVPVGTGRTVKNVVAAVLEKCGRDIDFDVVSNPEFLREGSAVNDFINPDRIVIGARNEKSANLVKDVYREQIAYNTPVLVTDVETAEMIKYASNAFLAAKVSFINEIANLCEECGIDVSMVSRGMGLDKRIGPQFINPGPGFGGSCFPKDVRALTALSRKYGCESLVLSSVLDVNRHQRERMISKIEKALGGGLDTSRIAVLGLSFKPGTDDIRESPAVFLISSLLERNASVSVYDPQSMENMKKEHPEMDLKYCRDVYSACSKSDCVVLATEWKEFSELNFKKLRSIVRKPIFMDLRNMFEPDYVKGFGFYYEGVGRK